MNYLGQGQAVLSSVGWMENTLASLRCYSRPMVLRNLVYLLLHWIFPLASFVPFYKLLWFAFVCLLPVFYLCPIFTEDFPFAHSPACRVINFKLACGQQQFFHKVFRSSTFRSIDENSCFKKNISTGPLMSVSIRVNANDHKQDFFFSAPR